ncbi:MAG: hypothetical protein WCK67_11895 [bacterium]
MKNIAKTCLVALLLSVAVPSFALDKMYSNKETFLGKYKNDMYYLINDSSTTLGENVHYQVKRVLYKPRKLWLSDNVLIYEITDKSMRCKDKLATRYKTTKYGEDDLNFDYKYHFTRYKKVLPNTADDKVFKQVCTSN